MTALDRHPAKILVDIIAGLQQATGASSQLIHFYGNPAAFIMIREALDLTKEGCMSLAKYNHVIG